MKKYCYILLLFGVLLQNPKIVLCGNTWLMLEKSGTSHFTKANLTYLQRFSRFSPEVQTYIAKFTDPMDGKGTLVKFLDDCDDDFVRYLNDPENSDLAEILLAHKIDGVSFDDIYKARVANNNASPAVKEKIDRWLDHAETTKILRKNYLTGAAFDNAVASSMLRPGTALWDDLLKRYPDLAERRIIRQVQFCLPGKPLPCNSEGSYFVADYVFVKYNKLKEVTDMVIAECKTGGAKLSSGQEVAKNAINKDMYVRSLESIRDFENELLLKTIVQGDKIKLSGFVEVMGDINSKYLNLK